MNTHTKFQFLFEVTTTPSVQAPDGPNTSALLEGSPSSGPANPNLLKRVETRLIVATPHIVRTITTMKPLEFVLPEDPISAMEYLTAVADAGHRKLMSGGIRSSASEAARKLEESRLLARTSHTTSSTGSPYSTLSQYPTNDSSNMALVKTSSASAAAALLESTANRLRDRPSSGQALTVVPPPGKTIWTFPKPIYPDGPIAGAIEPDYSWIMTGGNSWSNKHRQLREKDATLTRVLFNESRLARHKIYWLLPENQDPRVADMLAWVDKSSNLGTTSLRKFLDGRERGAIFINAAFRTFQLTSQPELEWLTFDQLQNTRDKVLQESTAFYHPEKWVPVFVYLPSQSRNSVAIWRRKINVPDGEKYLPQINGILARLPLPEDYTIMVDEY